MRLFKETRVLLLILLCTGLDHVFLLQKAFVQKHFEQMT